MNDAQRRRRACTFAFVITVLCIVGMFVAVGPAIGTFYYCNPGPEEQVVDGYMQPRAGVVVKLERSTAPGVIVASPTTGSDGTWCAYLPGSGNYDKTVGTSAKQAGQFFCLADLLPTPTPTATSTPTPTVTSTP